MKKKSKLKKAFTIFTALAFAMGIDATWNLIRGDVSFRNKIMFFIPLAIVIIYYLFISKFKIKKIFREQTGF